MKEFIFGNVRIQILSAEIIRIEFANNGRFCDANTFFIPDRTQFINTEIQAYCENNAVKTGEYTVFIPENANSLSGIYVEKNGVKIYTYKRLKNSGELTPLNKTPEAFVINDGPRIIVPDGGYTYRGEIKNSGYAIERGVQDIYLLLCGKDFKKLRSLYVQLTGRNQFVRLAAFGGWNSKYYPYTQKEAEQLILNYENYNVPLDVMVIDTDWRTSKNGWGYDVNTELFPDMKGFLEFAHNHGVEIMFNDHPEPVNGADVFQPKEVKYREENLQKLLSIGLDTWWYDRNWHTKLISPVKGLEPETLGMYVFEEITKHYYQKAGEDSKNYIRPVIMGNVNNVHNGKYLGILDSASHRFSVQWTGDIDSDNEYLKQEIKNLLKCSENCIPYVNSDCGGHHGILDKEHFIRWMQFGVFSPVFRPHCANFVTPYREPWLYDEETLNIVREFINLRYRLLPVIYKEAYENYLTGAPIFKSIFWNYPGDIRALKQTNEYMLGDDIIISPVVYSIKPIDKINYVKPIKATFFNGIELKGDAIAATEWKILNMDLNNVPPVDGVPAYYFSARFETTLKFDKAVRLFIRCDDGASIWIDGNKVLEDKTLHVARFFQLAELTPNEEHDIKIEYFQAGAEAFCGLFASEIDKENLAKIYLPQGRWIDAFDGKTYCGGRAISKNYAVNRMPLFVRAGALIPLAYNAHNTKSQAWDKLVFDFYPCKHTQDSGYLYEDDVLTTAYINGECKISKYTANYDKSENAFIIDFYASEGDFKGERNYKLREITLKYHLLAEVNDVVGITLNGDEIKYKKTVKDRSAFPLNTNEKAPDAGCIVVKFRAETDKYYQVKIYLK